MNDNSSINKEEYMEKFFNLLSQISPNYLPEIEKGLSASLFNRWYWLSQAGQILCPEYRFRWPQTDWLKNENFTQFLEEIDEASGYNADRRWFANQMLRLVQNVEGDMVECGTYIGATARLMIQACKPFGKKLHIFDSFEGVSEPSQFDGTHWQKGFLSASEECVHAQLKPFATKDDYTLYKGWIPERFNEVADKLISFVHIDVDLYKPTRDSIEFFYSRMNENAICLCDDYACWTCPGATKAIDEFLADKPEKMLSMPSGGGFFIKGVATALDPVTF